MPNDEVPEFLYKYRKLKNRDAFYKYDGDKIIGFDDNGLDALSKGKIWFSHVAYLNDCLRTMPQNIPLNIKDFCRY